MWLCDEHEQALSVGFSFMGSDVVKCSFVYDSCDVLERRALWSHLQSLVSPSSPWFLIGDFNVV